MKPTQFKLAMIAANLKEGTPSDRVAMALEIWKAVGNALGDVPSTGKSASSAERKGRLAEVALKKVGLFEKKFPKGVEEPNEQFLEILMPKVKRNITRETYWERYYNNTWSGEDTRKQFPFPIHNHKFHELAMDFQEALDECLDEWRRLDARYHGKIGSIRKKRKAVKKIA